MQAEIAADQDLPVNRILERLRPLSTYGTLRGLLFQGKFEETVAQQEFEALRGSVQLIFTSPPFALNNKKRYDNKQGDEYKKWLAGYAPLFRDLLTDDGSLVIELGNAWEPGLPVMSTLALEALLDLKKAGDFYLCQQFVVNNPARLPSPAQWVTVKRKRVTDSFTHVWWLAKTPDPKADNRRVLRPYSASMQRLLKRGTYNSGRRPSEWVIGEASFLQDRGGAIPQSMLRFEEECDEAGILKCAQDAAEGDIADALAWLFRLSSLAEYSNTASSDPYIKYCRENGIPMHPARMPNGLPTFFIRFLTDPGDLVVDPFAGSNTTGAAAETLERDWLAFEPMDDYVRGSRGRFPTLK